MRVLRYHPRAASGDGGMSTAIRRWARATGELGVETAVAYDGGHPRESGAFEWIRVPHAGPPGRRIPLRLERCLRRTDLLVLEGAWAAHNVVASRAARHAGVPYLLEPRGAYDPHIVGRRRALKRTWWLTLERHVVAGARGLHIFFASERGHLAALGYAGPVVVAPNGVDVPPEATWDGGSSGHVLWFGRFDTEHKGVDLLVDAVALLSPDERPRLRLHGPDHRGDRARLRRRIVDRGVTAWVDAGDPIRGAAKEAALASCTAFAYPSRWEGFGIAPAEAVARGVPLLATPFPFAQHLASRGGAVVVPPAPHDVAEGLRRLREPEVATCGATARRIVQEDFRWPDVGRSWLEQVTALL